MSLANRVWLAYWSLPRGRTGRPESFHRLEQAHEISNGTIGRIVAGRQTSASLATISRLSQALRVSPGWLVDGAGDPPIPTGPVPPRDKENATTVEESSESAAAATCSPATEQIVRAAVLAALASAGPSSTPQEILTRALLALVETKR